MKFLAYTRWIEKSPSTGISPSYRLCNSIETQTANSLNLLADHFLVPKHFWLKLCFLGFLLGASKMWNQQPYRKIDVEGGAAPLYPMMLESPQLRWAFIRKIYSIITIQLLATIAVAATVVYVRPISTFFSTTGAGLALYILLLIMPFIS